MSSPTTRLCSICIRGGSQGVPNKNSLLIAGKPLFAHSIDQARRSGLFNAIAVSSDCTTLLALAKEWGADHVIQRPDELATHSAGKLGAIQHCIKTVETKTDSVFDTYVDLDATSPLRHTQDIIGAVHYHEKLIQQNPRVNVVTGCSARRSPYFNQLEETPDGNVTLSKRIGQTVLRRQDAPRVYDMNASIYVWTRQSLFENTGGVITDNTYIYEMPEERSLDIDTPFDLKIVKFLMENTEI
jgi:N-acylneuraminate cytidylyltransferase/CMP-N,N'-diacetyllegionaminic acid synthase